MEYPRFSFNPGRAEFLLFISVALAATLTTTIFGCREPESSSRVAASAAESRWVDLDGPPPDPPSEFRPFSIAPMPGAPEMIERLEHDTDSVEARTHLVEIYRAAGYLGAARFFENTIREREGKHLVTEAVRTEIAWSGTGPDRGTHADEVVRAVWTLNSEFRFEEAAKLAGRDIQQHGVTLLVAAGWSHAILRLTAMSPEPITISADTHEAAIRIALTGLEEKFPMARSLSGKAIGYQSLAQVFFELGDLVSCRTAARLALHHLNVTADSSEWKKSFAQELKYLIQETGGKITR
jgi:hypothetical protein